MKTTERLRNYIVALIDITVLFLWCYFILVFGRDNPLQALIGLRKIIVVIIGVTVTIFYFTDMYGDLFKRYKEIVFNCVIASVIGIGLFFFFIQIRVWHSNAVRIPYILAFLLLIAFLSTERILVEFMYRKFMKVKFITIIGEKNEALRTGYEFLKNKEKTHVIKYIIDISRGIDRIQKIIENTDIVIMCPGIEKSIKNRIVELYGRHNIDVLLIPEIYEINTMRPKLTQIDDTPYLYFDSKGLSGEEECLKRCFDLLFSFILAILTLPVMLVCALIIKIESKGPVLFRQERISMKGTFNIIKLRTMVQNAEKITGAVLSGTADERVTGFGRFLRKTRLDEVPQIYNVLKGDMSLIGPRPERPVFIKKFTKVYPDYNKRHSVKAGISGLAQIMGKYSTATADKLRYDLIYIRNYSISLDIRIFFLTLKTVFLESGSVQDSPKIDYKVEMEKLNIKIYE